MVTYVPIPTSPKPQNSLRIPFHQGPIFPFLKLACPIHEKDNNPEAKERKPTPGYASPSQRLTCPDMSHEKVREREMTI